MGKINREGRITAGAFWLTPPGAPGSKYPFWKIWWYDAATEQRRGIPARPANDPKGHIRGVTDEDEFAAREALARHADANPEMIVRPAEADRARALLRAAVPLDADTVAAAGIAAAEAKAASPQKKVIPQADLSVITCILNYKAVRGPHIQQTTIPDALRNVMEIWGDPMVTELNAQMQDKFVAALRAQALSDWTILTRLKCVWAAINHTSRKGYLLAAAIPARTDANLWEPPAYLPNRQCKLTEDEVARLFDAACEHEHWWRYMIKETGEVARPLAPCETTPANVDWEVGNIDMLEIDREGVQTKKRKAVIRCAPTLLKWLRYWAEEKRPLHHDKHFIVYQGKRLRSMHFFAELAKRAGVKIPRKAGAYVLRHTFGTWLSRLAVPPDERKFLMGQKIAEGSHGFYMHYEPEYLGKAVAGIETIYRVIASKMKNKSRDLLNPPGTIVEARVIEEQPEAFLVAQAWPRLAATGLWVIRSPMGHRGYASDLMPQKQGDMDGYYDPDKKCPSE